MEMVLLLKMRGTQPWPGGSSLIRCLHEFALICTQGHSFRGKKRLISYPAYALPIAAPHMAKEKSSWGKRMSCNHGSCMVDLCLGRTHGHKSYQSQHLKFVCLPASACPVTWLWLRSHYRHLAEDINSNFLYSSIPAFEFLCSHRVPSAFVLQECLQIDILPLVWPLLSPFLSSALKISFLFKIVPFLFSTIF